MGRNCSKSSILVFISVKKQKNKPGVTEVPRASGALVLSAHLQVWGCPELWPRQHWWGSVPGHAWPPRTGCSRSSHLPPCQTAGMHPWTLKGEDTRWINDADYQQAEERRGRCRTDRKRWWAGERRKKEQLTVRTCHDKQKMVSAFRVVAGRIWHASQTEHLMNWNDVIRPGVMFHPHKDNNNNNNNTTTPGMQHYMLFSFYISLTRADLNIKQAWIRWNLVLRWNIKTMKNQTFMETVNKICQWFLVLVFRVCCILLSWTIIQLKKL